MDLEAAATGLQQYYAGVWQEDKETAGSLNDRVWLDYKEQGWCSFWSDYGTASEGIYGGRDGGLLEYIPGGSDHWWSGTMIMTSGLKDTSDALKNRQGLRLVSLVL